MTKASLSGSDSSAMQKFVLEASNVRGRVVHLRHAWRQVLGRTHYPLAVQSILGEALAAAALLSSTLKFDGSLSIQARGAGPIRLLVAQARSDRSVRGMGRWEQSTSLATIPDELVQGFGKGQMTIAIGADRAHKPYVGIVELHGRCLAAALDEYFLSSEQLPTRLWLHANAECAAGLLLQKLPELDTADEDAWDRACCLAGTVSAVELLELEAVALMRRLFHQEDIRIFEPEPWRFACSCSRQRSQALLEALGLEEAKAILANEQVISIDCEFCGAQYRFDQVDVQHLFVAGTTHGAVSQLRH